MRQASQQIAEKQAENHTGSRKQPRLITLSNYFPPGSVYFYSFPAGLESNFYNAVPPWIEELVAARPMICSGKDIRILTFASSTTEEIRDLMENECGLSLTKPEQIIKLPETISSDIANIERNAAVKKILAQSFTQNEIVMAQPFLDPELKNVFQIDPELSVWLNDKINLPYLIPAQHLACRVAEFRNGAEFAADNTLAVPCVVKVSSSSAGDGVRVCQGERSLSQAKKDLRVLQSVILVEEYIKTRENYCVQFAIPFDHREDIEIIGQNRQLVSPAGEFLGAAVDLKDPNPVLKKIYEVLLRQILPRVRARGWDGVGGIDVLVKENGEFYFIDANFRMTATFAYVCLAKNQQIKKPLISFTGSFRGSPAEFKNILGIHAVRGHANQILQMLSITKKQNSYWFNAGMLFDHPETVWENAQDLLKLGINSQVLANLAQKPN